MLSLIFPTIKDNSTLNTSGLCLVTGDDKFCLTSLLLQGAVTCANNKKRILFVGRKNVTGYIPMYKMPDFTNSLIDYISPSICSDSDSLEELLSRLEACPSSFEYILINDLFDIVMSSKTTEGKEYDQLLTKCLAFIHDTAGFLAKAGSQCSILAALCSTGSSTVANTRAFPQHILLPNYVADLFCNNYWSVAVTSRMPSSKSSKLIGSQFSISNKQGYVIGKFRYSATANKFIMI